MGDDSHRSHYDDRMGGGRDGPPTTKRYKKDDSVDPTNPNPSIVVHVRNLSPKATEADLIEALSHFGPVSYATVMPNKRMALVEFEELEGARGCVVYAQTNQIYVAGQPALFNYSTSQMIQRLGLESEHPNKVIIITVYNVQYPINVDVMHQICKLHGEVKRIAIVRRVLLQVLVEYGDMDTAKRAKHAMNGADIYSGCCTLKVEFAKPESVKVTVNSQDQWDFTVPPETMMGNPNAERKTLLGPGQDGGYRGHGGGYGAQGYGAPPPMAGGGGYGGRGRGRGGPSQSYYGDPHQQHDDWQGGGGAGGGSQVVMVYGVDQAKMNCDSLFNILCLYGNCERVKFMKSKPDTAMAQMASPQQVFQAIEHLHGALLFGEKLALRPSKQANLHDIREPFELPDGSPSFKDFYTDRNQRFSTPESATRNRLVRPGTGLHWYNAPPEMAEDTLIKIFADHQAPTPLKVVIFPSRTERSSSGVAEFGDPDEALQALMLVNHTPIDSHTSKFPFTLKLAFAGGRGDGGGRAAGGGDYAPRGRGAPRGGRGAWTHGGTLHPTASPHNNGQTAHDDDDDAE